MDELPDLPQVPRLFYRTRQEDVPLPEGAEMAFFTEDGRQVSDWWPVHAKVLPISGQTPELVRWIGIRDGAGKFDRYEPAGPGFTYSDQHGATFSTDWTRTVYTHL